MSNIETYIIIYSSVGIESACNAGDPGSLPGLGRSPGEGRGYPLPYSGLENPMDCIVHGISKSQTRLSDFHFTWQIHQPTTCSMCVRTSWGASEAQIAGSSQSVGSSMSVGAAWVFPSSQVPREMLTLLALLGWRAQGPWIWCPQSREQQGPGSTGREGAVH